VWRARYALTRYVNLFFNSGLSQFRAEFGEAARMEQLGMGCATGAYP
jgi:hypothetical protein